MAFGTCKIQFSMLVPPKINLDEFIRSALADGQDAIKCENDR